MKCNHYLVSTKQSLAELTFDMVSPGPNYKSSIQPRHSATGAHPAEIREGVANAYTVLTEVGIVVIIQGRTGDGNGALAPP